MAIGKADKRDYYKNWEDALHGNITMFQELLHMHTISCSVRHFVSLCMS